MLLTTFRERDNSVLLQKDQTYEGEFPSASACVCADLDPAADRPQGGGMKSLPRNSKCSGSSTRSLLKNLQSGRRSKLAVTRSERSAAGSQTPGFR